jgi:hypothetical protein
MDESKGQSLGSVFVKYHKGYILCEYMFSIVSCAEDFDAEVAAITDAILSTLVQSCLILRHRQLL